MLVLSLPWFLALAAPLAVVYHRLQRHYRAASRDLRRLDSVTRSPIFAHFGETLEGVVTLRAMSALPRCLSRNRGARGMTRRS